MVQLREQMLMPQGADEWRDFQRLPGSVEQKRRVYKAGILEYRPEKVVPYIAARRNAERERREEVREVSQLLQADTTNVVDFELEVGWEDF